MSDLREEPPDDVEQLDLAVETVEDLDADDSDADVKGGQKVRSRICMG